VIHLFLLLLCFFASGGAALLYQTAWAREFATVFGTSELAVAAVLAAYMAGLAAGAALAGRFAGRVRRPVLAYGALELGIALGALAVPLGIRGVTALYVSQFGGLDVLPEGESLARTLFHVAGAFVVLMPCAALMGATLPLLARHAVRSDQQIGPRVGLLYAMNTAGAIAGTVCTGFWLLPALGLRHTVYVGVGINFLVFLAAAALARGAAPVPRDSAHRRLNRLYTMLESAPAETEQDLQTQTRYIEVVRRLLSFKTGRFTKMSGLADSGGGRSR